MAAIETLRPAGLTAVDIPAALALSAGVGWNQTASDWEVFISHGCALGIFAQAQELVATAAALPYAAGFGWLSMVIVAPAWRRRGLARGLVSNCIALLRHKNCTALLDATPAGAEVYRAIGFVPLGRLERWEGEGSAGTIDPKVVTLRPQDVDRIIAADAAAFGAERRFLLESLLRRPDALALGCDDALLIMRQGYRAVQLGPMVATSPAAAARVLAAAIACARGPVFLDLFESWNGLAPLLETKGFRRQRPFLRMAQGLSTLPGNPARLVCAAGPEFG